MGVEEAPAEFHFRSTKSVHLFLQFPVPMSKKRVFEMTRVSIVLIFSPFTFVYCHGFFSVLLSLLRYFQEASTSTFLLRLMILQEMEGI